MLPDLWLVVSAAAEPCVPRADCKVISGLLTAGNFSVPNSLCCSRVNCVPDWAGPLLRIQWHSATATSILQKIMAVGVSLEGAMGMTRRWTELFVGDLGNFLGKKHPVRRQQTQLVE